MTAAPTFWAQRAWVDGATAEGVLISTRDGLIDSVTTEAGPRADAVNLEGVVVPGLVNAHSHVFHRALRGRVPGGGDFWSWRRTMYELVERLDPESLEQLAAATFAEMLSAGITMVGEFHYLHHDRGGTPFDDRNEMSLALARAAEAAGIRMCLLDTCYLMAGVDGAPLEGPQRRFSDGDADSWAERHAALADQLEQSSMVWLGAAIHSVRAVPAAAFSTVTSTGGPVHVHASEQPAENDACRSFHGLTPIGLLAANGGLCERSTIVHGVHVTDEDIALVSDAGSSLCVCPTTEFDLGDGTADVAAFRSASVDVSLGSDSHAVIDLLGEARQVEWNDRARHGRRGVHRPAALWDMATGAGARALGAGAWGITPGAPADLVVIDDRTVRTAGITSVEGLIGPAAASDVVATYVGGRLLTQSGAHATLGPVGAAVAKALSMLDHA